MKETIDCAVIISDLHCGCQMAVCPPRVNLDGGGVYKQSPLQRKIFKWWKEFTLDWIPEVTKGRPFVLVGLGDWLEGNHHGSTTGISSSNSDQLRIAYDVIKPFMDMHKPSKFYYIRGTPSHSGENGENEEKLARLLGAIPDSKGNFSRHELWTHVGKKLIHATHHIGTASTQSGESTALSREWNEIATIAGKWGNPVPHFVIRGHRHTACTVQIPYNGGMGQSITCPCWQTKTPFVHRIAGGRNSLSQIGAVALFADGTSNTFLKTIKRDKPEIA